MVFTSQRRGAIEGVEDETVLMCSHGGDQYLGDGERLKKLITKTDRQSSDMDSVQ